MKRFIPFILAASLAVTGCSKSDGPGETEKPIQEVKTGTDIRDKYLSLIPELEKYQHFIQGMTKDKKYRIVVANRDVELLAAYVDDNGLVKSKLITSITTDLKGKIGSIEFIQGDQYKENEATILVIKDKVSKPVAFEVLYDYTNSINILESNVSASLDRYLSSLTFTNKTVWFLSNGKVYMFNRETGHKTLESKDTSISIERNALALFYFEDNRMIAVTSSFGDLKVTCHPLTSPSGNFQAIWENSINGKGNTIKENIVITDDPHNIIVTLKDAPSVFKFKKSNGEPLDSE